MATVIMQTWDGMTPDQYDTLRETVGWDRDVPAGMRFHVASFGGGERPKIDTGEDVVAPVISYMTPSGPLRRITPRSARAS